jgi:hypothetical protein
MNLLRCLLACVTGKQNTGTRNEAIGLRWVFSYKLRSDGHDDLMCKISPIGISGEENVLVVTDQFSGYVEAVPLVRKSDAARALMDLCDV